MTLTAVTWLALGLASAAPSAAEIQATLNAPSGWKLEGDKEGVTVYTKSVPGSDLAAWMGVRVTDVDIDTLWGLICDVDNHGQISDMLHETRVLAREGSSTEYYQVSKSPRFLPVSERYWINTAQMTETIADEPRHHRRMWNSVPDTTPYADLIEGLLRRYPDAIRMTATHGSWELKPRPDGKTEIIYRTFTDPGGSVPSSVMDYLTGRTLPNNILQFEEAARERTP